VLRGTDNPRVSTCLRRRAGCGANQLTERKFVVRPSPATTSAPPPKPRLPEPECRDTGRPMDVPDWDQHDRSIRALADVIEQRLPLLTSRSEFAARQYAAAYLARCRRLVLAIDAVRGEFPDAVGTLLRPMFETWLTANWLVLDPDEAMPALANDYKVEVEKMTRLAGLDVEDVDDSWKGALQSPKIGALVVKVGRLLVDAGDPGGDQLEWSYNLVYRNESIYSVHGGLGPVLAHLDDHDTWLGVLERRTGDGDGSGRLLWAGDPPRHPRPASVHCVRCGCPVPRQHHLPPRATWA